jgi:inosose dehydratase
MLRYLPKTDMRRISEGMTLSPTLTRRAFAKSATLAASAMLLPHTVALAGAPEAKPDAKLAKLKVGHTGITWSNDHVEQAVAAIASLGFYGFETFGEVLEKWETQGGFGQLLERNHIPLISSYCNVNLVDTSKKSEELEKAVRRAKLIKKYGGRIMVVGPISVDRATYKFADHKTDIVTMLNETAKAVSGEGITAVLHQHTGTCVESRDETYSVMHAVDTRYVKFGPDIGQLTKGGSDAVQVVKDFLPLIEHMHVKDYNGLDSHLLGYCPLGQGKADIPAILKLMEDKKIDGMIMGELDNDWGNPSPTPPLDLIRASKSYLQTLGVKFRA